MFTAKKAGIVTPTGDFVSNLVLEMARRIVRNGERVEYLMKEFAERFPDMTKQQTYTLLAEAQKLGVDVEPNDWLFYTPIENRAEVLNKYLVKKGTSHGSRSEDVTECIKCKKEKIKEIKEWLTANPDAERLSPQTFYRYKEMEKYFEGRIKELQEVSKLTKSGAFVYVRGNNLPFTLIGINEDGRIYGILKNASGDIVRAEVGEMQETSDKSQLLSMEDAANATGLPVSREFEQLAKSGDPLKTFMNTFSGQADPTSEEGTEDYITDFLQHIDNEKDAYVESQTFTPEQINSGLEKIKEFVEQKGLKVNVDAYLDKSLELKGENPEEIGEAQKPEGMGTNAPGQPPVPEQGMLATPAQAPAQEEGIAKPAATKETMTKKASDYFLPENSMLPIPRQFSNQAATKLDIKIADSLSFLNKIETMIHEIKIGNNFNRTAELDASMTDLAEKVKDLKFFVREELINQPVTEKEAAYVVLAHIVHDLEKLKKQYDGLGEEPNSAYVAARAMTNRIKKAKSLLDSIN